MEVLSEEVKTPRELIWLVDTLERLTGFPPAVRKRLGFVLYQAQIGQQYESAKMMRGFAETVCRCAPTIRAEPIERYT
jgi:phage-related protein